MTDKILKKLKRTIVDELQFDDGIPNDTLFDIMDCDTVEELALIFLDVLCDTPQAAVYEMYRYMSKVCEN